MPRAQILTWLLVMKVFCQADVQCSFQGGHTSLMRDVRAVHDRANGVRVERHPVRGINDSTKRKPTICLLFEVFL